MQYLKLSGVADRPVIVVHRGVRVEIPRLLATAEIIRLVVARIDRGDEPIATR